MLPERTTQELVERLLMRWYVLLSVMLLGGLLGWLVAHGRAPVYEASAVIRVRLDGPAYAAEKKVDVVSARLREDTLGWVEAVMEQQIAPEADAHIQRFESRWLLTVRDADPHRAAALANAWAYQALDVSEQYLAFARQAQEQEWQGLVWQHCLENATDIAVFNACADTSFASLGEVPPALSDGWQQVRALQEKARHYSPALSFEFLAEAKPPTRSVLVGTAGLSVIGALLGLLAGFWLAAAWPERKDAP